MHIHFLDPYHPGQSPIHALDGRVKFVITLMFILMVSLTPVTAWPAFFWFWALVMSLELLSGVRVGYFWKRSLVALPFALAALPLMFTYGEQEVAAWSFHSWRLAVYVEGLARLASIVFKSWLSVQAALVLTATTPFPELLQAMRSVGVPHLFVAIFGLMWRYLFVLADEALRLMRARAARSAQSEDQKYRPGGNLLWRATVTGGMVGNIFLRGFDRSERIYQAMLSRGYDGERRVLPLPSLGRKDWGALIGGMLMLGLGLMLGILVGTHQSF